MGKQMGVDEDSVNPEEVSDAGPKNDIFRQLFLEKGLLKEDGQENIIDSTQTLDVLVASEHPVLDTKEYKAVPLGSYKPETPSKQESQSANFQDVEGNVLDDTIESGLDPTLTRVLSKVKGDSLQSKLEKIAGSVVIIKDEEIEAAERLYTDDVMKFLFRDIRKTRLLTPDEEYETSVKYRETVKTNPIDNPYRDKLVKSNLRLVVSIAKKYLHTGQSFPDLIQDGIVGLISAIDNFNPDYGFKLSTYATISIRREIMRSLDNTLDLVRKPIHVKETLRVVQRAMRDREAMDPYWETMSEDEKYSAISQDLLNPEEGKRRYGLSVPEIAKLLSFSKKHQSFQPDYGDEGSLAEFHYSINQNLGIELPTPNETIDKHLQHLHTTSLLLTLPDWRSRMVFALRFGLYDSGKGTSFTLEEVGEYFSVTRERIRQIEKKARKRIKQVIESGVPLESPTKGQREEFYYDLRRFVDWAYYGGPSYAMEPHDIERVAVRPKHHQVRPVKTPLEVIVETDSIPVEASVREEKQVSLIKPFRKAPSAVQFFDTHREDYAGMTADDLKRVDLYLYKALVQEDGLAVLTTSKLFRGFVSAEAYFKANPQLFEGITRAELHNEDHTLERRLRREGVYETLVPEKIRAVFNTTGFSIDEHFFDQQTPATLYVLGAFFARGSLKSDRISFRSQYSDLVDIVQREMKSGHKIYEANNSFSLEVRGHPYLRKALKQLGINLPYEERQFPAIAEELVHHFIRGFIETRGTISRKADGTNTLHILYNEQFLKSLHAVLASQAHVARTEPTSNHILYATNDTLLIHDFIYRQFGVISESGLYVPERKEMFRLEFRERPEKPAYQTVRMQKRLETVPRLLQEGDLPSDIAWLMGYQDSNQLSLSFARAGLGNLYHECLRANLSEIKTNLLTNPLADVAEKYGFGSANVLGIVFNEVTGGSVYGYVVKQRLAYIQDELRQRKDVQDIAEKLQMPVGKLTLSYQEVTGENPTDYSNKHQMELAKSMLAEGVPVLEVAAKLGYAFEPGFQRWFLRNAGMSPHHYQQGNYTISDATNIPDQKDYSSVQYPLESIFYRMPIKEAAFMMLIEGMIAVPGVAPNGALSHKDIARLLGRDESTIRYSLRAATKSFEAIQESGNFHDISPTERENLITHANNFLTTYSKLQHS